MKEFEVATKTIHAFEYRGNAEKFAEEVRSLTIDDPIRVHPIEVGKSVGWIVVVGGDVNLLGRNE